MAASAGAGTGASVEAGTTAGAAVEVGTAAGAGAGTGASVEAGAAVGRPTTRKEPGAVGMLCSAEYVVTPSLPRTP